ncbi:MAG: PDZ domain-containing protein, partial [Hydrogenophaga sp.]|nr:PDZ domain-containing protein [Hydrogenophaga sp.]
LPKGVAIVQVGRNSPAARAGLQPFSRGSRGEIVMGDVITAIGDEPVESLDDMLAALERRQPGDQVTLSVWRAGQVRQQTATLAPGD